VLLLLSLRGRLLGAELRLDGRLVQHLEEKRAVENPGVVNARNTPAGATAGQRTGLGAWMALSRSAGSNCFLRDSIARVRFEAVTTTRALLARWHT
jgi:hypothetical protein